MSETLNEITARSAAERYAQMQVAAAGATEKVTALEELLKESEYCRMQAEMQLSAATWPEGIGQVYHAGTEEPGEDVYAIIDIYSGKAYRREIMHGGISRWVDADKSATHVYSTWPLGDDSGPFIKLKDDWYLRTLVANAEKADKSKEMLKSALRMKSGYRDENAGTWEITDPFEGAVRAYRHLETHAQEQASKLHQAERSVESLTHALEAANAKINELLKEQVSA